MDTYRALYIAESRENHENIVKNLLILENGTDTGAIAEIFRSAHSLKGMSASMGYAGMEKLCHAMEDIFQEIRNDNLEVSSALMDALLSASDKIEAMLDDIEAEGQGMPEDLDERVEALKKWTHKGTSGAIAGSGKGTDEDALQSSLRPGEHRFRISVRLKDGCENRNLRGMIVLQNLEDLGSLEKVSPDRAIVEDGEFDGSFVVDLVSDAGMEAIHTISSITDVQEVSIQDLEIRDESETPSEKTGVSVPGKDAPSRKPAQGEKADKGREVKNIRVDIHRLDQMMNLVEDLVINRGRITQIARRYQIKEMDETLNMIGRSVSDLQNLMMNIRMIPLNHIFNRFPRTVRDIARREGKEVEFVIEGGDTELDRSIMDGLNDPLLHLIRNAIDHGIESPTVREAAGKPAKGTLLLSARRDRDNVIITIADDGGGIDIERVRKKAIERGLISAEAAGALPNDDVIDFLFRPGFSTAEAITDISGRGVGLDVVRTTIESLKGSIKVESTLGKGSRFELLLPPTMAIVTVMMVRINGRRCAIPVHNVVEVASLVQERIHSIGGHEAILLRDEVLPLDRLDDMFGHSEKSEILVVIQQQNRKRTICADSIEGQQEVVIKPLSNVVGICRGISGVTIPGDGEVVPVLDVNSMIKEN
jgi:two-component system chemotaxis sensor kinase CheA